MGRGLLEQDVLVDSPKVLPVIEILSSSYGHPRNSTKSYDICTKLRNMIDAQVAPGSLDRMFSVHCRLEREAIRTTVQGTNSRGPTFRAITSFCES